MTTRRCPITNLKVSDGDTIVADVSLGWCHWWRASIRLLGYDAPELHPVPFDALQVSAAKVTRNALAAWLAARAAKVAFIQSNGDNIDLYGRILADVIVGGELASAYILQQQLGRPYDGKTARGPWEVSDLERIANWKQTAIPPEIVSYYLEPYLEPEGEETWYED